MKPYLTIMFMLPAIYISAQDINTQILQQISIIRTGNTTKYGALEESISKSPNAVFKALEPYRTDTLDKVRQWTYAQYNRILRLHEKPKTMRQDIVMILMEGIADPYYSIRDNCVDYLVECKHQDFTPQAQKKFSDYFNSKVWFSKELVLLAGFIGNADCRATLEDLAYSQQLIGQRRLKWSANLALTRMGDRNAENWCLKQINHIGINDDVIYDLLPGLIYTRQKRCFEFLITILNSDEKFCTSTNPDLDESILCGYRIMEYLAPVIKGYPLILLPSGDIDTNDYHKALLTTRDWFAKKNGDYEIVKDSL